MINNNNSADFHKYTIQTHLVHRIVGKSVSKKTMFGILGPRC